MPFSQHGVEHWRDTHCYATRHASLSEAEETAALSTGHPVNGKRIRTTVGPNKKDAELVRSKVQSDLLLGKYGLATSRTKSMSLHDLVKTFVERKKHRIKATSLARYKNYCVRLETLLYGIFFTEDELAGIWHKVDPQWIDPLKFISEPG